MSQFVNEFPQKTFFRSPHHRFKNFSKQTKTKLLWTSLAITLISLFLILMREIGHSTQLNNTPANLIQTWDESVLRWIETIRTPLFNAMMIDISSLGGLALTVTLGFVAVILFILSKDGLAALHFIIVASGSYAISIYTKGIIERPRPSLIPKLVNASGFSFPSGHAITISAVYVTIALLTARHFKKQSERFTLFMLSFFIILMVCFSRIYLGVHYLSDTLSGTFLGTAWALTLGVFFLNTHHKKWMENK